MTDVTTTGGMVRRRRPSPFERLIVRLGRAMMPDTLAGGITVLLPSGNIVRFRGSRPGHQVRLTIRSWRVIVRAIQAGANGFAESYIRREVDTPDLVGLIRFFASNRKLLVNAGSKLFQARFADRWRHLRRANSKAGSRRNIADHYDLSNEFFRIWLDETMTYSSARFASSELSLKQAQTAKYDRVIEALQVGGSDKILEIGCGWGGFAEHVLPGTTLNYTGITLSNEQLSYAKDRPAMRWYVDCDLQYMDYRDSAGSYDAIVSIEMIEAVGREHWAQYFKVLHDRLKPGGNAVIQSIVMTPDNFERYSRKADFIQRYIFPGGMLPTTSHLVQQAEEAGLTVEQVEMFPQDYARTLSIWRKSFEENWPAIARLGFDNRFRRLWRYYLSYCEGAFAEEVVSVGMFCFSRPKS